MLKQCFVSLITNGVELFCANLIALNSDIWFITADFAVFEARLKERIIWNRKIL
jgi:hypothetical protein